MKDILAWVVIVTALVAYVKGWQHVPWWMALAHLAIAAVLVLLKLRADRSHERWRLNANAANAFHIMVSLRGQGYDRCPGDIEETLRADLGAHPSGSRLLAEIDRRDAMKAWVA